MNDTQHDAIAKEIADMKALQELLLTTEQKLLSVVNNDPQIRDRFNDFLKDDQENLTKIR